jgi:DNA ligase 1
MNHKPMLAVDCGGIENVTFPVLASPKLDGVRAILTSSGVLARSLKPIPNIRVQEVLGGLPVGLDGELLAGDPTAPDVYRKTVSMVMSDDKPIDGLVFHVFDDMAVNAEAYVRTAHVAGRLEWREYARYKGTVCAVRQEYVTSAAALASLEAEWITAGYEGVILRKPDSPYKHGRSTLKEGYLLKLKRFVDGEAEVIGVTELMHNGNEAKTNALGRTERSHKKAGLVGAGVMGTLVVRDIKTGVEFEIGTGFTAEERTSIWNIYCNTDTHFEDPHSVQRFGLVKYKHFPSGAKDKPRHPVFLGWRDRCDT